MRVLAWNTSWNCDAKRIDRQIGAVEALGADVAFFSGWSSEPSRSTTAHTPRNCDHVRPERLDAIGLTHQEHEHVGHDGGWTNATWTQQHCGLLAASREPIRKADVENPGFAPGTWLEVEHEPTGLVLASVRVPAWERQVHLRRQQWEWMLEQFERLRNTRAIVVGDFNTEMTYPSLRAERTFGSDLLQSVSADLGWRDLGASCCTPAPTFCRRDGRAARIDYGFASPALDCDLLELSAPRSAGGMPLVGRRSESPLADHTPVVVDVELAAEHALTAPASR